MNTSTLLADSVHNLLRTVCGENQNLIMLKHLMLNEIESYQDANNLQLQSVKQQDLSPFAIELIRLNALIRLIKKRPINLKKILCQVDALHLPAQLFLDFEVKKLLSAQVNRSIQDSTENELKFALAALENTRAYFREPSGSRYSQAQLDMVRALVRIYKTASSKPFGISSSSTTRGPEYMTPSEKFLFVALELAGNPTTIDGMRELYRAAHRGKKGSKKSKSKKSASPKSS